MLLLSHPSDLLSCHVRFIVFRRWLGDGAGQNSVGGGLRALLPKEKTHPQQCHQHDHLTIPVISMAI